MSEEKRKFGDEIEPLFSKYINSKGVRLGLPVSGIFELTPRCNFNCKMCYVHLNEKQIIDSGKKELSKEEIIAIAKEARDAGMVFVLLTGGEPFVRKDFFEILEEMKNLGLLVSINSNGSMINDEIIDKLKKNPPIRINITLYGGCDETYEKLCGRRMYHKVVENIKKLKEAGIPVRLNTSITPYNVQDIKSIYDTAKELDVFVKATTYMFPPIRVNGGNAGEAPARFSAKEAAKYMLECREQYMSEEQLRMYGSIVLPDLEDCSDEREGVLCRAGRSSFWLTWDGHMMPCGMMNVDSINVREVGFEKAWDEIRKMTEKIRLPKECSHCKYRKNCNVCAASTYAETGNYEDTPTYICEFVQTLYHLTKEKYGE